MVDIKRKNVKLFVIGIVVFLTIILFSSFVYINFLKEEEQIIQASVITSEENNITFEEKTDEVKEEYFDQSSIAKEKNESLKNSDSLVKNSEINSNHEKDLKDKQSDNLEETNPNLTNETSNESVMEDIKEEDPDEVVLSYMRELDQSVSFEPNESVLKEGFITVVDFLFYEGEIKGVSLNEITLKTKLTFLKYTLSLDNKIEEYFPGYKESISKTTNRVYTEIKESILVLYLKTTTKICDSNSDLCHDAKRDFQSLKDSFGFTWDLVKKLVETGTGNLKEWYEIYSGK